MTALRTDGANSYTPTPEDTPWHRLGGSEAVMALANDTFAPLTGRVEIATEKLAKVA